MIYKLFKHKEECYYCMDLRHLLIKSEDELICRDCYKTETGFLFRIFQDLLTHSGTYFGYSSSQMKYFQSFTLAELRNIIHIHFSFIHESYIGEYAEEITDIITSVLS